MEIKMLEQKGGSKISKTRTNKQGTENKINNKEESV